MLTSAYAFYNACVILRQFVICCPSLGRKIQDLEKDLNEKHHLVINKEKNDEKVNEINMWHAYTMYVY